jgi:RHS repeat-associated protein
MNLQATSWTHTSERVSVLVSQTGARRRARRGAGLVLWAVAVFALLAALPATSLAQGCSSCAASGSSCEKVKVGFAASVCSSSGYTVTLDGRTATGAGSCTANSWVTTPLTEVELTIDKPVKLVAGTDSCSTHVVFNVPKGYKLFVDGVETKTVDKGGTAKGSGDGTWDVVVRKCDECEENEGIETCDTSVGSVNWSVSLGKLSDGRSAQTLSIREDFLSSAIYTPAALTYTPPLSGEIDVVRGPDGSIRQIKVPRALGDVIVISAHEYEVRFYDPANVGAKSGGLYPVSGQPFLTWRFKNPDPSSLSRLQLSEIEGGVTTTVDYAWDAITNTWSLDEGAGARVESKTITYLTDTSRVETTTVKDGSGRVVSKTARTLHTFPWGEEVLEVVVDPEGAALKTVYSYYEDPASGGRYRKLKSVTMPSGAWEKYDYDANGNLTLVMRPWKDLSAATATTSNSRTTTYTYSNSDGVRVSPYPYLVSSVTEKIENIVVRKTTYSRTGAQIGGEPATVEIETVYSAAAVTQTSSVTRYHPTASPHLANKTAAVVRADGTMDTYTYEKGNYAPDADPALSQFTPNPNGTDWRESVVHGTTDSPDGVALKTMKETTIRNRHGHAVLSEMYVYTGAGYERVGWSAMDYDSRGNLTQTRRHNGEIISSTWSGHRKTSATDSSGAETVYTYDEMGRVKTETKKGVAAGGPFPAQPDMTVTYTYDAEDRVIAETLTGGGSSLSKSMTYDGAGRVKSETNSSGLTTTHTYADGGRTHTINYPGGATQTAETYLDGQTKIVTGTAGVASHYEYGVNADGTRFTREFKGVAGTGSPRWVKTTLDWLGRVLKVETPSFTGATLARTSTYNAKGQLVAKGTLSGTTRLIADSVSEFDALGREIRSGLDVDSNGVLAPLSADRFAESDYSFRQDGGDWFNCVTTATYLADNSDAKTDLGGRCLRLNNFPAAGAERTVYEVRTTNEADQTTITYTSIDRAAKKVTTTADGPESNVNAVRITVNGLLQSSSPSTPQAATTYVYDGLGRLAGSTDPRAGTTSKTYHATTGQLVSESDAAQTTTYEYYPSAHVNAGRMKSKTNAKGKKTFYAYDADGAQIRTWGDAAYPVEYVYDDYGQRTEMRTYRGGVNWGAAVWPSATAGTADVTRWIYHEPTGLLERKRDAANKDMSYAYDALGRSTLRTWARVDAFGTPLSAAYSYDPLTGDLTAVNYSDSTPDVTFAYDRGARAQTITDAAGTRSRTFNQRGELKAELIAGGILDLVQINTPYDAFLRRQSAEAARGANLLVSQTYGYDAASRLETITAGGQTVTYSYHPDSGLLANTSFTGGTTVGRTYDALGRTQAVTTTPAADAAQSYAYTYNNLHQRTRVTREDGGYWAYDYNDRGELASGKKFWADNTPVFGQQTEYAFDNIGNRTASRAGGNALGALRQSDYATNPLNQYTQRTVPGAADVTGTAHGAATVSVNNEPAARRGEYFYKELAVNNSAAPAYAQINVVGARNNFGPGGEDAVTEKGGRVFMPQAVEAYSYDADGNLTSDGRWNYAWDAEGRLTFMEARPNVPAEARLRLEFAYDWAGRRIEKKVYAWNTGAGGYQLQSVARFVYDGWNLLAELDGAGAPVRSYVWGQDLSGSLADAGGVGGLLLVRQGADAYHVGYDGSGNATTLVNAATGAISASYEYDPFGNTLKAVGDFAAANPFRFSTKYADAETGLVYYGFRYYQPQTGRWLSRDPLGEEGGVNLYGFVSNNPVSLVDPLGQYEQDVHYYLTYYLARASRCFDKLEARFVAEGNQQADEDDRFRPAQWHGWLPDSLEPFTAAGERQRDIHERYHALTDPSKHQYHLDLLMNEATIQYKCGDRRRRGVLKQKLMAFGRYLHYRQDMFSHAGHTSPIIGHAANPYDTDHTDERPELAMQMARQTWEELRTYAKKNKCDCDINDGNPRWDLIEQFLRAPAGDFWHPISDAELDAKRRILNLPKRKKINP